MPSEKQLYGGKTLIQTMEDASHRHKISQWWEGIPQDMKDHIYNLYSIKEDPNAVYAYCVSCKQKREMLSVTLRRNSGRLMASSKCPVCDRKLNRILQGLVGE